MKTSRIAVSTPETLLMNVAQTELAHSYGMPALSVGFVPDSSELGFRAGVEDMALALFTRLGRPDIMTGLGTLESGQAVSLPKMLLDAEIVSYLEHVGGGFAVDDDKPVCRRHALARRPGRAVPEPEGDADAACAPASTGSPACCVARRTRTCAGVRRTRWSGPRGRARAAREPPAA